ncbi:MAG TPA: extracellular solute-binding protein [Candidatus Limiplasma sp.]|nr:extracellular solute-binding protein [Candidatus Limiplasma sp.]
MYKRLIALLLALFMCLSIVSAVAEEDEELPSDDVTLTFVCGNGDVKFNEVIETLVAKFEEEYPMIDIVNVSPTSSSFSEGLKSLDAVNEFPDLIEARDVPMWARAGKIAEVDPELIALVNNAPDYNGKYYCVPTASTLPLGFYYNKAYFDEKGFTEPTNYQEFLDLCQAIKDDGQMSPIVVGAADIWHVGFSWMQWYINYVTHHDTDFVKHLYTGDTKWTDDYVVDCFTKYADIFLNGYVDEGFMSTSDSQIASFLVTGKAAMFISGSHMVANIEDADPDFDFGWFPLYNEDGELNMYGGPGLNGWMYSVDCAADEDKLIAAKLWIKFYLRDDNYAYYLTSMSVAPVTNIDISFDSEIVNKMVATLNAADSVEQGWNGKWGDNEIPSAFRNFAYKVAQEWATGSKSIEQGLEEMQTEWDVLSKDFNPVTGVGITE